MFPDYGRTVAGYDDAFYVTSRGIPVFRAALNWDEHATREDQINRWVAQARSFTPAHKPAFLHLFIWNWGLGSGDLAMITEVQRRLGPDYVAVRPEHLAALAHQYLDREQVQVRMPAGLVAIADRPLTVEARVQNVSRAPLTVTASAEGLTEARVAPDSAAIAPAATAAVTLTGRPAGKSVTLVLHGPFGERRREAPLDVLSTDEIVGALPPAEGMSLERRFEAAGMAHRGGEMARLPGSLAVDSWTARPGVTDEGHIVFGPYAPLAPGKYLALFRLQRTGEGNGTVVHIDAHVGGANDDLGSKDVLAADLPQGRWRCVPLTFDHPGGTIETRVYWPGKIPVAVDSIVLWRLTG